MLPLLFRSVCIGSCPAGSLVCPVESGSASPSCRRLAVGFASAAIVDDEVDVFNKEGLIGSLVSLEAVRGAIEVLRRRSAVTLDGKSDGGCCCGCEDAFLLSGLVLSSFCRVI